ncbi:conserved hypothetical protein [Ricinus communis]|uniref:Uncharacterized protein n=1 Tax=Ricinus communis TaxID=3988 RepID=B9S3W4_RICCO|nr:conserved hypothetical protein [Ricinus communis]
MQQERCDMNNNEENCSAVWEIRAGKKEEEERKGKGKGKSSLYINRVVDGWTF